MTFLPNQAYDASAGAERTTNVSPGYLRNPAEIIVDVTDLADDSSHYEYIDMDGFDCIILQCEVADGSGGDDEITFYWYETLDPVTDPTGAGVQWTASSGLWGATSINNSAAAIDRVDTQTDNSVSWYRFEYKRTVDNTSDNMDPKAKIKRWKRGA